MTRIDRFEGDHAFLSNFFPSPIEWQGLLFPTVEHAFQAAKSADPAAWKAFTDGPADAAVELGRRTPLRADWADARLPIMAELLALKFEIPALRRRLLATGDAELVNGAWWGDRFWGRVKGEGDNRLGVLLMELRAELVRKGPSLDRS